MPEQLMTWGDSYWEAVVFSEHSLRDDLLVQTGTTSMTTGDIGFLSRSTSGAEPGPSTGGIGVTYRGLGLSEPMEALDTIEAQLGAGELGALSEVTSKLLEEEAMRAVVKALDRRRWAELSDDTYVGFRGGGGTAGQVRSGAAFRAS